MDPTPLPEELIQFQNALLAQGFKVTSSQYDEAHFGDRVIVLTNDDLQVRLIRDRSQWFVETRDTHSEDWFQPMIWRAYFDRHIGLLDIPTIEQQCQMILDDLDRIGEAVRLDGGLLEQLRSYRLRRYEARQGGSA
jgi:hypothetical protein